MGKLILFSVFLATTVGVSVSFAFLAFTTQHAKVASRDTALNMGTNRRSRRKSKKKQTQSRPNTFFDNIKEAGEEESDASGGTSLTNKSEDEQKKGNESQEAVTEDGAENILSSGSIADAPSAPDDRPDVSTIVTDDETGIERIQQGKNVMDVVTRKAVKLSDLGPMYRLAQMFPGVPPEIREKYRFDTKTIEVSEMIEKLREVSLVSIEDELTGEKKMGIPPHPQVSNEAIDFVLANRDLLGPMMKKTLGRLKLRAQSLSKKKEAIENRKLWKHFITLEDSISAPFRQMLLDAEGKVGRNFGNLDMMSYCSGEIYERAACYLILKGMVAHWEKKVRDAEYVEATPQDDENFLEVLMVGDPKRYLPEPPIIHRYSECVRITLMAQNMTAQFVNTPELYNDLPPEIRFIEAASFINGGATLRQFMIDEFCPAEDITPEALREGVRRLDIQLSSMQLDPYGDLKNVVGRLCDAISVGTDDARDPYTTYLANLDVNGPGYFQTYTFNHDRQSLVRFLDSAKDIQQAGIGPTDNVLDQLSNEASTLLNFQSNTVTEVKETDYDEEEYKVPEDRACGRPHNVGWLNLISDEEIFNEGNSNNEDEKFDSDNWREVTERKQAAQ